MKVRVSLKEISEALDRIDKDEAVFSAEIKKVGSRSQRALILHFNTVRIIELDVECKDMPQVILQDNERWIEVKKLLHGACEQIKNEVSFPDVKIEMEIFKKYVSVVFKY